MVIATMTWRNKAVPEEKALGINAFDAGKTMCRLISLYHSLSDQEIVKLHHKVIKSKGITYLNSQHECFLLNLASAERLEELDTAADAVSRLGRKCSDSSLGRFDLVYADLKLGLIDLRKLGYGCRNSLKMISKMEKLVSSTRSLYTAMESVAKLEISEKRQRLKTNDYNNFTKKNLEYLDEEIECCRKQVQHYKEVSLWNQTLDKTVGMMAKVVCIVYARICSVFGGYIANCSCYNINGYGDSEIGSCCCLLEHRELYKKNYCLYEESLPKGVTRSGPIPKGSSNKTGTIRFLNRGFDSPGNNGVNNRVLRLAPPSTVGGAGLAARYAEVVLLAEQCLHAPATMGASAREAFYGMLPERLRRKVAAKLKGRWRKGEEGEALAEGWRYAVEKLLEWLSPVAHDTVRWQEERSVETARFEAGTTALLLQTLHYSDLEKAEAAIVEVLVGLSCICRCERT